MPDTSETTALISGGTRGLGAALAEALLERGWRVAVFARRGSAFVERAEANDTWAGRFQAHTADVRDGSACDAVVEAVQRNWGRIDLLVNNAGVSRPSPLLLASDDYIQTHIETNLTAALRLSRSVVRVMLPRRAGRIINITSVVGIRGYSGLVTYSAAKAGLDAFTRSLAKELGPAGITVNALAPGYLPTEMTERMPDDIVKWNLDNTPLGRLAEIDDVLDPLLFLCSDDARFITGHTLVVDGGLIL